MASGKTREPKPNRGGVLAGIDGVLDKIDEVLKGCTIGDGIVEVGEAAETEGGAAGQGNEIVIRAAGSLSTRSL